jgi:enamine deaminase RidA (YjgF/YER057c/UK114 family)
MRLTISRKQRSDHAAASEGRGHRLESCRARHCVQLLRSRGALRRGGLVRTLSALPVRYPFRPVRLARWDSSVQFLNPDTLGRPIAPYSNIIRVKASEFLFIAGQVGMDKSGKTPADFEGQCPQVFANIGTALASQGAGFPNIVEFTSYLVHSQDIGKFVEYRAREYPRLFPGGGYPTNTLLIVDRLVREEFLIEVSAVAAL